MATEVFAKSPIGVFCTQITQQLIAHPMSAIFRQPVTDENYLAKIAEPIDLGTIKKKIKDGNYLNYKEWMRDVDLVFENSIEFNGRDSVTGGIAVFMQNKARKLMKRINWFNHQNFEEYVRSVYRAVSKYTAEILHTPVQTTPKYEVKELSDALNALPDTTEVEQMLKKGGEQRILKRAKDNIIDLDHLSRKTLDALWLKFGTKK